MQFCLKKNLSLILNKNIHFIKCNSSFFIKKKSSNLNKFNCVNKTNKNIYNVFLKKNINKLLTNILFNQFPKLKKINNTKSIEYVFNNNKKLKKVIWNISCNEKNIYLYKNDKFIEIKIKKINKLYFIILYSKLINNFFYSALKLGIEKKDIINIVKIMNKYVNFKKLNYNDKFIIFNISNTINTLDYNNKKLIGIKFFIKNKEICIFKFINGKFYNLHNFDIKFINLITYKKFRISSNFNLNRFNPITSKFSPHNGIDIAMPIGTPILSVGNGIVEVSKKDKNAGNYIIIRHNNKCITKYMHLKKSFVKSGQKVYLGDKIGLSGNSGRSTGPHLHFEIWMNFKAVNPLTFKLNYVIKNNIYLNSLKKLISDLNLNKN